MIGAIAGDVIGSVHERRRTKTSDFPLFEPESCFTDDTVLTVATAHAILNRVPYDAAYRSFGRAYPDSGYGGSFYRWLMSDEPQPYNSFGNGSAMRVSPVGFAFDDVETVLREAERSASVTHNHPDGIKGAQAAAVAVFMARSGFSKEQLREEVGRRFHYDLSRSIDHIRPDYHWSVTCEESVPQAIVAFLDSTSVESAIRLAVSLGGDADTQAAIAGAIAQAFYRRVPAHIVAGVRERLPVEFIAVLDAFERAFPASAADASRPRGHEQA
jgi:ADP-ribosylglycohydrolase